MKRKLLTLIITIAMLSTLFIPTAVSAVEPTDSGPEVWLHTLHPWLSQVQNNPDDYFEFLTDTTNWPYVAANVDAIRLFGGILNDYDGWTDARVAAFCNMIKATGIKVALENGGMTWDPNLYEPGQDTLPRYFANVELSILDKFVAQGVVPDSVCFDGSLYRLMYSYDEYGNRTQVMSLDDAVEQFVFLAQVWKETFPNIKINYLFNFPNNMWKGNPSITGDQIGDAYDALIALVNATTAANVPLNGITIDSPYDYNRNGMALPEGGDLIDRVRDVENTVKNLGLKFNLTFNCEASGDNGTDAQYYKDTLQFIHEYEFRGGSPDVYIIESWYDVSPSKTLPETEPYTLTYLAAEVLRHVKEGKPIDVIPENLVSVRAWDFSGGIQGWDGWTNAITLTPANGVLNVETSNYNESYFGWAGGWTGIHGTVNADSCDYIKIRVKNLSANTMGYLYFAISGKCDEDTMYTYTMQPNSNEWQDIYIKLTDNSYWAGNIEVLRLSPGVTEAAGSFEFKSVELLRDADLIPRDLTTIRSWDFSSGIQGWDGWTNDITLTPANGVLQVTTGFCWESYFGWTGTGGTINAANCNYIKIRVKNTSPNTVGYLYFAANGKCDDQTMFSYTMKPNSNEWQDIYIKLTDNPYWVGTVDTLRITPGIDFANGYFEFDSIELLGTGA